MRISSGLGVLIISTAMAMATFTGAARADATRSEGSFYLIFEPHQHRTVEFSELTERLAGSEVVVLGEKHNTPEVQQIQARIIESVALKTLQGFDVAWEFLDFTAQETTASAFTRFKAFQITALDFLRETQGGLQNSSYAPILEVLRRENGGLLGVNLSREDKAPVVKGGTQAANPDRVPPGFKMGGADYLARFEVAMGGHATPDQVQNYFAAQCLTDDVMAHHLVQDSKAPLKFLVAGGFHTDYSDGVVARIRKRSPKVKLSVVRVEDASDYQESELPALFHDDHYGDLADFVVLVNRPRK
ncbi:MAG: ChaN family lipoprotein [Methylotenera sp.]|nr:ChaN family lipoprotein [Oligoflexia bacterium]